MWSLEFHLCPESEDYSASAYSAYIREILNDWLEKEHRSNIKERVEFGAVLRPPVRNELAPQTGLHVTQRHGVVKAHRKRLVEAQARSAHRNVPLDVGRAPVVAKRRLHVLFLFSLDAPESL